MTRIRLPISVQVPVVRCGTLFQIEINGIATHADAEQQNRRDAQQDPRTRRAHDREPIRFAQELQPRYARQVEPHVGAELRPMNDTAVRYGV